MLVLLAFFAYAFAQSRWTLRTGDVFHDLMRNGSHGPELVVIPAGSIGSVVMTRPFAMAIHETSFEEYDRFAAETRRDRPDDGGWGRGTRPVINISWRDAHAYAQWLSAQTGRNYRLPTETEWEYASRSGAETAFWWGRVVGTNHANCADCGSQWDGKTSAPRGSFSPNPFGLFDMNGNVAEWTCSVSTEQVPGTEMPCPAETDQRKRVIRGGSWQSPSEQTTVTARLDARPDHAATTIGFRVMMELPDKATRQ